MNEFDRLIHAVKDKYEDFLIAFSSRQIPDDIQKKLVDFMRKNPDATTSDIIQEYTDIIGIKPVYEE